MHLFDYIMCRWEGERDWPIRLLFTLLRKAGFLPLQLRHLLGNHMVFDVLTTNKMCWFYLHKNSISVTTQRYSQLTVNIYTQDTFDYFPTLKYFAFRYTEKLGTKLGTEKLKERRNSSNTLNKKGMPLSSGSLFAPSGPDFLALGN